MFEHLPYTWIILSFTIGFVGGLYTHRSVVLRELEDALLLYKTDATKLADYLRKHLPFFG